MLKNRVNRLAFRAGVEQKLAVAFGPEDRTLHQSGCKADGFERICNL